MTAHFQLTTVWVVTSECDYGCNTVDSLHATRESAKAWIAESVRNNQWSHISDYEIDEMDVKSAVIESTAVKAPRVAEVPADAPTMFYDR